MKTGFESGLLLYNTDQSSYADYLGIELFEGKIRLLMNKGNGPTELIHGTPVADGKWHRVAVDFNPSGIGITVDRQEKAITLPSGGNRYLDLADTLYIGGTELNKRARALGKGLKSGDVSYKGCLRNMLLDNKELGLPDVKISQGIIVGCVWGFPCIEADPCLPAAVCSQLGVTSFNCRCDQPLCIKPSYAEDYKVNFLSSPLLSFFPAWLLLLFSPSLCISPACSISNFPGSRQGQFTRELGDTLAECPSGTRRETRAGDER